MTGESRGGVLSDLGCELDAECATYGEKAAWLDERLPEILFDSRAVTEMATSAPPWIDLPGIYFLTFKGRIAYVGQGGCIGDRINAHKKEGRPFDAVAFIVGLPRWILSEVEHAYIAAWSPPWNAERQRSGALRGIPDFRDAVGALCGSMVSPDYPARARRANYKAWELHVMGYLQSRQPG